MQSQVGTTEPASARPAQVPQADPPPLPGADVGAGSVGGPGARFTVPGGFAPRDIYRAAQAKREELSELMIRLRNRRADIASQLRDGRVTGSDRAGLEQQLKTVDARIIEMESLIQQADKELITAAGVPGAKSPPRSENRDRGGPPEEVFIIVPVVFTLAVLMPMAVAHARRIWKRSSAAVAAAPQWMQERFVRLEQAVDAIAIEVESIGEGQRFMTKLFSEGGARAIPQSVAQSPELPTHDRASQG